MGPHMKLNETDNTFINTILSESIHRIRFKILSKVMSGRCNFVIGIRKLNAGPLPINTYFSTGSKTTYAFRGASGYLDNHDSGGNGDGGKYGQILKQKDVIEMIVNFNDLTLKYIINNKDYGVAFKIEETEYKAAVNIKIIDDSIQLLP